MSSEYKLLQELIQEHNIQFVDLRFTDFFGLWQHFSIMARDADESLFEEGVGFDGSSIRGFQSIEASDMVLLPDMSTAFVDPFFERPTLAVICSVYEPGLGAYSRCPRSIARKAEEYLISTGIADTAYFGPEPEFFIFDNIRYAQNAQHGFYHIDSEEAIWNAGHEDALNLGYKIRHKQGYFPCPPHDTLQDVRSEICEVMERMGMHVEVHHHEVGTAGQCEIDWRFDSLVSTADQVMMFKYIVRNVAKRRGKVATFMPKPIFGDNGSGMHVHESLFKNGENLFYDKDGYALLSDSCLNAIGGILHHAPSLLALTNPSTNSYKRLVPGFEAPVNLVYSQRNRSAAVRIPAYNTAPNARRLEFRSPDPTCNPYLAFSALLMASLDGIQRKIDPGDPTDVNLYNLPPEEQAKIKQVPTSLEGVINALEADHEFLTRGEVFTPDVVQTWIEYKRENEIDPVRVRPHPYEFYLYFDA